MSGWSSGKQKAPEVAPEAVATSGATDSARRVAATYLLESAYPKDTVLIIADRSEFLFKVGDKVTVDRGDPGEETKTIIALEDTNIHIDSPLIYTHAAGATVDQPLVAREGATKQVCCFPCFPRTPGQKTSRGPNIAPGQQSNRGVIVDNGKLPDDLEDIASLTRQLEQEKARLKALEDRVSVNGPLETEDATVIAPIKTREVVEKAPIMAEDAAVYSNNTGDASSNGAGSWWILSPLWTNDEPAQNQNDHQPAQARSMVPSIWASDDPVGDEQVLQQSNESAQEWRDQSGLSRSISPREILFDEGGNEELASSFEKLDAELKRLQSRSEEREAIVERTCEPQSPRTPRKELSTATNEELRQLREQLAQARVQVAMTWNQCQGYATDNQQLQDRHDALEQELQRVKAALDTVETTRQFKDLQENISSQEIKELRKQLDAAQGMLLLTQEQCQSHATDKQQLQDRHNALQQELQKLKTSEIQELREHLADARGLVVQTQEQCQTYATDKQQLQDRHDALKQELHKLKTTEIQQLREHLADARGLLVKTQGQCENYATSHRELQVKHDSLNDELKRVKQLMIQNPPQDGALEDLRQRMAYLEDANKAIREQAEDREIQASERVKQLELERDELTRELSQENYRMRLIQNHVNEMEALKREEIAKIDAEYREHIDEMQRKHEETTANFMGSVSPDELEVLKDEFRQMEEKYQQHIQVLEDELQRFASLQAQEDEKLIRIQELEGDLELLRDEAERALSGKDIELQDKSLMLDMHQRELAATQAQLGSVQQQSLEQAQQIEALGFQLQSASFEGVNNESTSEDKELILQLSAENASLKEQLASTWAQINAQMAHLEDERQHYLQESNGPLNGEVAYASYIEVNNQREFETVPSELRPGIILPPGGTVDEGPVENRPWGQPLSYSLPVQQVVQAQPVFMTSPMLGAPQPIRRVVEGGSMNLPGPQRGSTDGLDFQTYPSATPWTMPVVNPPAQPAWTFGSSQMVVHAKTLATVPIESSSISSPAQAPYTASMGSPRGVVNVSETMPCRSSLDVGPHIIMRPPNALSDATPCRSSLDAGPQMNTGPPNTFPSATFSRNSFDVGPQITMRPPSTALENAPYRSSFDDGSLKPVSLDSIVKV